MSKTLFDELVALPIPPYPGLDKMPHGAVRLLGCGKFEQFCATLRAELDPGKFCPFCLYDPDRDLARDLLDIGRWWLRGNAFQKGTTGHMSLIVPRRHVTGVSELTIYDWEEIGTIFGYAAKKFNLVGGGLVMRFGDPRYNAGTVEHLHINLIMPESPEKEYRAPLSKNRADRSDNYDRLLDHRNELMQRGGIPWLFSEEGVAATKG